jgi:DNA mismatch repair protein MutL
MSDIIQLLPDALANQIAAGEVVQRPASVVKELLENAIDAGATSIKLLVKDAGRTLIQVIDNGSGMSETDARMCFERHATSKIRLSSDLFAINTMGFRGEAMASIAAVAQVELKTCLRGSAIGTHIDIADSRVQLQEPVATPEGSSIAVKNLFYNVPARRNFLKSNTVEMRHVIDEFQRIALAHPEVFFSLTHNTTELYHLPIGNLRQRIVGILGKEYNAKLVPISEETDVVRITGFVGKPEAAKKTRGEQFFFVNTRFIKSNYLSHAISTAYDTLIGRDVFPLYCIFIEIDPKRIDVNVHPTKQEIKFDDERLVYNYLKVATRYALGTNSVMPSIDFDTDNYFLQLNHNDTQTTENTGKTVENMDENATVSSFVSRLNQNNPQQVNSQPFKSRISSNDNNVFRRPEKTELERNNLQNWQKLYDGLGLENEKTGLENEKTSLENETNKAENSNNEPTVVRSKLMQQPDDTAAPRQLSTNITANSKQPYQLHNRFILSPLKSGFLLVDQQAAHERILYERYLDVFSVQNNGIQQSLFPKTITLSIADAIILRTILDTINELGFDLRDLGNQTFVLQGIPTDLLSTELNEQKLIEQLLEHYKLHETIKLDIREQIARALARQNAVKRGSDLTPAAMQHLIDELFACTVPYQSPYGQTCFVTYDMDDILKKFG